MLEGLFDYAGMFPPASLSLEDAVKESHEFSATLARPELVGNDLVLTPESLARLPAVLDEVGWARPCRVCVVGVEADAATRYEAGEFDVDPRVQIAALEPVAGPDDLAGLVCDVPVFVEVRWSSEQWARDGPAFVAALKQHGLGAKIRCAGEHALDAATLAIVISLVADARLPWKATQGLHHPHPGPDAFGFLNVLTAFRLREARGHEFRERDIQACLEDADASHFRTDVPFWKKWMGAGTTPFSIGSCSLQEPDGDLRHLAPAR